MTKEEVAKEYTLDEHGVIRSPGKFEGEPWWVQVLWNAVLDGEEDEGFEDDADVQVSVFLRKNLPEDIQKELNEDTHAITLYESETGFVYHSELTKEDAEMVLGKE